MTIDPTDPRAAAADRLLRHNHPAERETMADTAALLSQVASVYGARHPELHEIETAWADQRERMSHHWRDEGSILEVYVDEHVSAAQRPPAPRSKIAGQHDDIIAMMRRIRALTNDYAAPPDACDAYRALYSELKSFEASLQEHVHLADDVLSRDPPRR